MPEKINIEATPSLTTCIQVTLSRNIRILSKSEIIFPGISEREKDYVESGMNAPILVMLRPMEKWNSKK